MTSRVPQKWWIIQTQLSYAIGEPVYRVLENEPDELTKRTSVRIIPVSEVLPEAALDNKECANCKSTGLSFREYWGSKESLIKSWHGKSEEDKHIATFFHGTNTITQMLADQCDRQKKELIGKDEAIKVMKSALEEAERHLNSIVSGLTTDINRVEQLTKGLAYDVQREVQVALQKAQALIGDKMKASERMKQIEKWVITPEEPNLPIVDVLWLIARCKRLTKQGHYLDTALAGMLEGDDIECRADEDCDHCFAEQAQKEWAQALEDES